MSSSSRAKAVRKPTRPAAKPTRVPAASASTEAKQLAAVLERALASGRSDALSVEALQALTAALCKTYAAQIESGAEFAPLRSRSDLAPTDVMCMASGLLKGANLAVFELGMWQSWTGR
jgi:hypothetical protein